MTHLANAFDIEVDSPVTLGAFTLTISRDDHAFNPWEENDCMTPLLVDGGRNSGVSEYGGENLRDFFAHVPPSWVSRHWRALCDILYADQRDHDDDARENAAYDGVPLGEARADDFATRLVELTWSDRLTALATLYNLAGWPATNVTRSGYSQGDTLDILLVATPDHVKACGMDPKKHDWESDFGGDADTYAAWAFGDVYGYTIHDAATGETMDSCYGFIGAYWSDGYILTAAADVMDEIETAKRKARAKAAKTAIRARVPLIYRPAKLDAATVAPPY